MKKLTVGIIFFIATVSQYTWASPAQFHGLTMDQWFKPYFQWYLNGSSPANYGLNDVKFLRFPEQKPIPVDVNNPHPAISISGGTINVQAGNQQYLLIPVTTWVGERYTDGSQDDPSILVTNNVFNDTSVEITLDGRPYFSGTADQLASFHFGPFYFDTPIPETASTYGAIAYVWEEGVGLLLPPLPKGRHTLRVFTITPVFGLGFDDIWSITVTDDEVRKYSGASLQ